MSVSTSYKSAMQNAVADLATKINGIEAEDVNPLQAPLDAQTAELAAANERIRDLQAKLDIVKSAFA